MLVRADSKIIFHESDVSDEQNNCENKLYATFEEPKSMEPNSKKPKSVEPNSMEPKFIEPNSVEPNCMEQNSM